MTEGARKTTVLWPIEGFVGELPRRFLGGHDLDLLAPLRFLDPTCSRPELATEAVDPKARRQLARAIVQRNRLCGHPQAERLGELLAEPDTRVVVTGQQAGLLGGPLYTLTKAVAAARWAAQLEADGQPAVALFWVATEDHDYAEVARCLLPAPGVEPKPIELADDEGLLCPVGERKLGPSAAAVCSDLAARTTHPGYRDWLLQLAGCCAPEVTFGASFGQLLVAMLGDRCPLLLDSQEPTLKELQRPLLQRLVEQRIEVDRRLAEREREIERRSLPLQVASAPGWSPLFLIDDQGQRRRIGWHGTDRYRLRGDEESEGEVSELLQLIERSPERVTPGVLARPALQDGVLGTALFVLGPGELAYMAQAAAIHEVLEVSSTLALRPQAMIVDARRREHLEQLSSQGIALGVLLGSEAELESRLAELCGGRPLEEVRQRLAAAVVDLRQRALEVDPQLESAWERTRDHIDRALDHFDSRVTKALAKADQVTRSRALSLREICLPGGSLQERAVTAAHFPGLYGADFVATLWRDLELDPRHLQVLTPGLSRAMSSGSTPEQLDSGSRVAGVKAPDGHAEAAG